MQGFPNVDGEKAEVRKKFGVLHRLEVDAKLGIISLLVHRRSNLFGILPMMFCRKRIFRKKKSGIFIRFCRMKPN
jgi:hypothetical protein